MSADAALSAPEPSRALALLDKALLLQAPLAERHIARLKRNHPDESPRQIVRRLNAELRAATISAGVGVGAAAAAPGVGTGVALAMSGTEMVAFLNATVLYILARSEVQDIKIEGSVAKIVKLEHAWRRLDGRNDDGFQVAPFPG